MQSPCIDFGFKVCRMCLAPYNAMNLTSMFAGKGEIAEMFQQFASVDLLSDQENGHSVMICESCSEELEKVFELREFLKEYEKFYFEPKREAALEAIRIKSESKESSAVSITEPVENALDEVTELVDKPVCPMKVRTQKKKIKKKQQRFVCEICEKTFSLKGNLRQHYKRIHLKIKNIFCDHCNYSSYYKHVLGQHVLAVHVKPAKSIKCNIGDCTKIFATKKDLCKHKSNVHSKPIKCKKCGMFIKKNSLRRHNLEYCPERNVSSIK